MNDYVLTVNDDGDLAIRTVPGTEDSNVTDTTSVITRTDDGKLAVRVVGSGGGSDQHNLGWYATQAALEEAYPTAEAGDWAIVGSTDTVWIWDTDNEEWVDSDQKGQVTSVNNQTGDVTIGINDILPTQTDKSGYVLGTDGFVAGWVRPEIVQRSALPQASEEEVNKIYQYVGTTDASYTNGYFYKCVSDGGNPATYSWVRLDVQPTPSGLPDQTGQSGKFLTTDGTDASWSDKPLVNTSTGSNSLTILGTSSTTTQSINIGVSSTVTTASGIAIGASAKAGGVSMASGIAIGASAETSGGAYYPLAIGSSSKTTGSYSVSLGQGAICTGDRSIQLGTGTNSESASLYVSVGVDQNYNPANYKLLGDGGKIPTERLTKVNSTITLTAAGWSSNTQTVSVTGMTATGVVLVSPDPTDQSAYTSAGIICSAQAAGTLTFTCSTTPSADLSVNVVML